MRYSVLLVDKKEDYTEKVAEMAEEAGITQTILVEEEIMLCEPQVLRDSITNLLYQIAIIGVGYPREEEDREVNEKGEKIEENDHYPEDEEMFEEIQEKDIIDFFEGKNLGEVEALDTLRKIEARLLYAYEMGTGYFRHILEKIDKENYTSVEVGSYYYLFNAEEQEENEIMPACRIFIGEALEEDFGKEYNYEREHNHNYNHSLLPYGVLRSRELKNLST